MSYKFRSCVSSRRLRKVPATTVNIGAELSEAGKDLGSSKKSLDEGDYKWSTIKAYYSMFHAFRSLLYSAGYTEKNHDCLIIAIEELFVEKGLLPSRIIVNIRSAKAAREAADYGLTSGKASAEGTIDDAEEIYRIAASFLEGKGEGPSSPS